jgi:hypothetical protein
MTQPKGIKYLCRIYGSHIDGHYEYLWDVTPQKIVLFLNGIKLFLNAWGELYYPSMYMVGLRK